ncbi:MAG: hypothetical protein AAGE01_04810 [Pseudomonadota bacterium]
MRTSPPQRLTVAICAAVLLHVLVLFLYRDWRPAAPEVLDETAVEITLTTAPPRPPERPVRVESSPPPPPAPVVIEARPRVSEPPPTVVTVDPAPETEPPAAEVSAETERVRAIIRSLDRFNLADPSADVPAPDSPPPRFLGGEPTGPTVAMVLDHDEIALPFEDSEMEVRMYSGGVRGDLERLGDAVTKTWEFKTPGGMRIRCAWILVIYTCSW